MTDIRYTPVRGGQTFGNPGDIFNNAARSLNRATTGASEAFHTFRQGAIDARDQRTQEAIASLQSAQSLEDQANLASTFASPEAIRQNFGEIDTAAFTDALTANKGRIQTGLDEAFAREQAVLTAGDRQSKRDATALAASFDATLNQIAANNPTATREEFAGIAQRAGVPIQNTGDFISTSREATGQADREKITAKQEADAVKGRETILNRFSGEDNLSRFLPIDSSRTQAIQAVAQLQELGVSAVKINRLIQQSIDSQDDFEPGIIKDFILNLNRDSELDTATTDFTNAINTGRRTNINR